MSNSKCKAHPGTPAEKNTKFYDNVEFSQTASLFHVCASCIVFSKADYHPYVTKTQSNQ